MSALQVKVEARDDKFSVLISTGGNSWWAVNGSTGIRSRHRADKLAECVMELLAVDADADLAEIRAYVAGLVSE